MCFHDSSRIMKHIVFKEEHTTYTEELMFEWEYGLKEEFLLVTILLVGITYKKFPNVMNNFRKLIKKGP